jgi:hypothetical protein
MTTAFAKSSQRTIRIFLSSTFRDFGEERDLLVRQVFPALRAKLKASEDLLRTKGFEKRK